MITHQDDMHPHLVVNWSGMIPFSIRLILYAKSLQEAIHLQLVSPSLGTKIINPVSRICRVSAEESANNPLLSFKAEVKDDFPAKTDRHCYPQLATIMSNTVVDLLGLVVEWIEPRTCQGKGWRFCAIDH